MISHVSIAVATLLVFTLAQQTSGEKICVPNLPLPFPFRLGREDVVVEKGFIGDLHTAAKNLRTPLIFPLLFGNLISRFDWIGNREYRIELSGVGSATFRVKEKTHKRMQLTLVHQHENLFPVHLVGMKIRVSLSLNGNKCIIKLALRGPSVSNKKERRRINIFKRALAKELIANARLVLGFGQCSSTIPSIRGICNNIIFPTRGITNSKLQVETTGPVLTLSSELPNARFVSNALCKEESFETAPNKINYLLVIFGQFLDHDITLTPSKLEGEDDAHISVPHTDFFMSFHRSDVLPFDPEECCSIGYDTDKATFFNGISAFIDGSAIYGSDYIRACALRSFKDGKLTMRQGDDGNYYLPFNNEHYLPYEVDNEGDDNDSQYAAGDVRANENPVLVAFHTLFAREHNRICHLLKIEVHKNGKGRKAAAVSDEWYYQQARRIVIAELQSVVYNEFLPLVLGHKLSSYEGYSPSVDPSISNLFSTVAFRFGHSALRNSIQTRTTSGDVQDFFLKDVFFNPLIVEEHGLDAWLFGAMNSPASAVDLQIPDSVRNTLFNPEDGHVLDLLSFNIQRGRDQGLMSYSAARNHFKMKSEALSSDDIAPKIVDRIKKVYDGALGMDAFIGGLAESPFEGSILGRLFYTVVKDQFERLRDGDRFYYENVAWGFLGNLEMVKKLRNHDWNLADIIKANTEITADHLGIDRSAFQTM